MDKRIHIYVSRKNVLTWLMALCMIGSAVARIYLFSGVEGIGAWSQIVLPIAAALLYAAIVLISGDELLYKTAIPAWMAAVYAGTWVLGAGHSKAFILLFWIALFFFAFLYTQIISGKLGTPILLLPVIGGPLAALLYRQRASLMHGELFFLPDILMLSGALILVFVMRIHGDGKYHPTWGDRTDGRRVRTLSPMAQITSYFQVERNSSSNLFEESFEITHAERYIRAKRREGYTDFGLMHLLLAAYVRGVAKYPQVNRFISGQKVYSRDEDIQYLMVVKKEMTVDAPDTSIKVHLTPRDTALDVYKKLNEAVAAVKATQELDSSLDNVIMHFTRIPSVLMKFVVWLLKLLDYFGLLPRFLLEVSPFHGSLIFTNLGSLGIRPVYHHLYDFGNLPAFIAFGMKRKAYEVQEDGSVALKKYIDVRFTLDERIVDGFYYAAFIKYYRRLIAHPEVLDNPPEEIVKDID